MLLINSRGTFTVFGARVGDAPGSTDELLALLEMIRDEGRLVPLGASPQVWIVGETVAAAVGWNLDYADDAVMEELDNPDLSRDEVLSKAKRMLSERISGELMAAGLSERGWALGAGEESEFRGGPLVNLKSARPGSNGRTSWFRINVFVEPYLWTLSSKNDYGILGSTAADTMPPQDERGTTGELARRLRWMMDTFEILPSATSGGTAAALLDQIYKRRKKTGVGAYVDAPTPWPSLLDRDVPVEAELLWSRRPSEDEVADARFMVTVDQRASYLASAGMQEFGWGSAELLDRAGVEAHLSGSKIPFGLWLVTVPAGGEIFAEPNMPLPLPVMRQDRAVQAWLTTESLMTLCSPLADGGADIDIWSLDIEKAYVYEHQGRVLEAWASLLRKGRAAAIESGDRCAKGLIGSMYKAYVGRLVNEDAWSSKYKHQHFQPMWRYAIIAGSRRRGRRQAARIAAETGLWPIASHTDSWTYLCATEEQVDALSDKTQALGRLELKSRVELTDEMRQILLTADSVRRIESIFSVEAESTSEEDAAAR